MQPATAKRQAVRLDWPLQSAEPRNQVVFKRILVSVPPEAHFLCSHFQNASPMPQLHAAAQLSRYKCMWLFSILLYCSEVNAAKQACVLPIVGHEQ